MYRRTPKQDLVLLLRITGGVCAAALPAVFLPAAWMAQIHALLGLGTLPDEPIFDYVARLTSAMFVFYGLLLWVLATDPPRYAPVIRYQAIAMMGVGATLAVLGQLAGMPLYWAYADLASVVGVGAATLWLQARVAGHRSVASSTHFASPAGPA